MSRRFARVVAVTIAVTLGAGVERSRSGPVAVNEEALWHHRNLGKAFYENPTTQAEAVEEFKKALDLAPESARERVNYGLALLRAGRTNQGIAELERAQKQAPEIPHTWFNLGVAYKRNADYSRAIEQFEAMVRLAPDEPVSRYNLGSLYKLTGESEKALAEFEVAAKLDPHLAGPHFQLYNAIRDPAVDRREDADRERKVFDQIKRQQAGAAVPEDLEWSYYAEILDDIHSGSDDRVAAASDLRFESIDVVTGIEGRPSGLLVLDAHGDGRPDLLIWSSTNVRLLKSGTEPVGSCGLEDLHGVVSMAAGDFDNDGLPDLAVVLRDRALLYHNRGGTFDRVDAMLPSGRFVKAVWLDYDHDHDLDLILLGQDAAVARNNGTAGFTDQTADFPFVRGSALDAVVIQVTPDTPALDLVVTYADRAGVVYHDRLAGRFDAVPLEDVPANSSNLAVADLDGDGRFDLLFATADTTFVARNVRGGFEPHPIGNGLGASALVDVENRAALDLISAGGCYRYAGALRLKSTPCAAPAALHMVAADFDGDGRTDVAAALPDGNIRVLRNASEGPGQWLRVRLLGAKNAKRAPGAVLEVKAGSRYQKALYDGVPIVFGLGTEAQADTVRITWPNGLIQNEISPKAGQDATYKEAPRLSGSCPMIFAWSGNRFQFITDVLGVAPLGASAGDGQYFPVDHDEYVQIPGSALKSVDGLFDIRVTEELHEVSFIDQVKLFAVDHPADIEIFTNEKFKAPPYPSFRLFGTTHHISPVRATDDHGCDLRGRLLHRDAVYVDDFPRDYSGVAAPHHLDIDFGRAAPANRSVLVLNGWVDWADGSSFLAAAQERPGGLALPSLQVKDQNGLWQTVVEDMGLPAGKPKTIVVDLTGKFLSASREVRIVTSLCVYWDQAFLLESSDSPPVVLTLAAISAAELRFRGFSRASTNSRRLMPELFEYDGAKPLSMWNPTQGLYTRYGDVRPLVADIDDRLVIMGSGDEMALRFDARHLPSIAAGWTRDFLLLVDGWAKDADANTAFSQSVEPLPFHGMSAYPYTAPERFPEDQAHRQWRAAYNTRLALRLIRPLHRATVAQQH